MSVCVCSKIIKELPGLVGSGAPYTCGQSAQLSVKIEFMVQFRLFVLQIVNEAVQNYPLFSVISTSNVRH